MASHWIFGKTTHGTIKHTNYFILRLWKLTTTNAYQPYSFSILNMQHTRHARVAMCEGFKAHETWPCVNSEKPSLVSHCRHTTCDKWPDSLASSFGEQGPNTCDWLLLLSIYLNQPYKHLDSLCNYHSKSVKSHSHQEYKKWGLLPAEMKERLKKNK